MPYYRAYVVGSDGVFQTAHSLDCEDDEAAIEAAKNVRRVLLVETSSAHVGAWRDLIAPKPVLSVIPRDGVHPIQTPRESMN